MGYPEECWEENRTLKVKLEKYQAELHLAADITVGLRKEIAQLNNADYVAIEYKRMGDEIVQLKGDLEDSEAKIDASVIWVANLDKEIAQLSIRCAQREKQYIGIFKINQQYLHDLVTQNKEIAQLKRESKQWEEVYANKLEALIDAQKEIAQLNVENKQLQQTIEDNSMKWAALKDRFKVELDDEPNGYYFPKDVLEVMEALEHE